MVKRPDATLVKGISKYHELAFLIMKGRNNSNAYFDLEIEVDKTLAYLEKINRNRPEEEQISLFEVVLSSLGRVGVLRPRSNRFISGGRLWQRNEISISFVVKREKTDDGEEVNAKILFSPYDTIFTVSKRMKKFINEARYGENPNAKDVKTFGALPRFLIKLIVKVLYKLDKWNIPPYGLTKDLPMFSTVYLAHLGSLNMKPVYHHLFELGTTGFMMVMGRIEDTPKVNPLTKAIEPKKVFHIKINIDERIADGIYWGKTVELIKEQIENPERMEKPLEITQEMLDELRLKPEFLTLHEKD